MRDPGLRAEPREVDHRDGRDLGPGARGRRHGDERKHRPGNLLAAADRGVDEVEQLAVVGGEERAELRRVESRAAADPDEAVEAVPGRLDGLLNGALTRLAGDAVVDDRLDAGRAERCLQALPETGFGHEPVADEKRPSDPEATGMLAGLGRGPCAEDDARALERDDRGVAAAHEPLVETGRRAASTAAIASSIEIDVAVLRVDVEQRGVVRIDRPVGHGLPRHEDAVAVLEGVHRRRADASRRGRAGDDNRVAACSAQLLIEVRAEEGGGEELDEHGLLRATAEPRVDLDPGGAGPERGERRRLCHEHRGALEAFLVVGDGGEEHRHGRLARRVQQPAGGTRQRRRSRTPAPTRDS